MTSEARTAKVDLLVYSMDAVLKSSYRFTSRCFLELKTVDDNAVEVILRPKRAEDDAATIMAEFLNDLIDQRLRTIVATETAATRDLIMAHALSQTTFLRPDRETADPANISIPVARQP